MANGYNGTKVDTGWWLSELRRGLEYRKKNAMEDRWEDWRKYYRGQFKKGQLPVNLFFRMVRMTVPRVYFRNPSISVIATKPGIEQLALSHLVETVDNKLIRTMRMKQQIKRMVQHAWMFGTAIGKIGFGSQYALRPEDFGDTNVQTARDKPKEKVEYHAYIRDNFPWFASVHPSNFIVPHGTARFEEARWSAIWIRRALDDVKSDPRFKHTANLATGKGSSLLGDSAIYKQGTPPNPGLIDLVEIRDTKTQKVFVLAPYASDKVLLETEDQMQYSGKVPNYVLVFNEDDECMWGVPDSCILEPQQLEINEIRTLQMKHRRMTMLKLLHKKNAIENAQLQKLLDGDVLAAVEVLGEIGDVKTMQVGDIPQSLFAAGNELMNDVRENLGFSRNQAGNYAESSADRTATEAKIVQEASEIRIDERRDMVADIIVDAMYDTNRLVFDQWSNEMIELVMGPEGLPVWVAFKPHMLKAAEYEINIQPDSSAPETKAAREAKALALYERLKTNPLIDPVLLTKFLLHELQGMDYERLLRVAAAVRPGPGGTQENPLSGEQYMQQIMQSANAAQAQGGGGQG